MNHTTRIFRFVGSTALALGTVAVFYACEGPLLKEIRTASAEALPHLVVLTEHNTVTGEIYPLNEQLLNTTRRVELGIRNDGGAPLVLGDPTVELDMHAFDGSSGAFEVEQPAESVVSPGSTVKFALEFTPTEQREYSARIIVHSNDRRIGVASVLITGVGYIPAAGVFQIEGNAPYTNSLTVTLNAAFQTDPVEMSFSNSQSGLPDTVWENYSETRSSWLLSEGSDGKRTVYARFRDDLGFVVYKDASIDVDRTPPTGSIVAISGGAAYTNTRTVALTLASTDSLSGVADMRFVSSTSSQTPTFPPADQNWIPFATSHSYTIPIDQVSQDGIAFIHAQFRDHAGNVSNQAISNSIVLDTSAPSGSVVINGGAQYTNSRSVSLALTASSTISGVSQMRFVDSNSTNQPNFGAAPWLSYNNTHSYTLQHPNDGTKFVHVQLRDNAGNISTSTIVDSIILDTVAPTGTFQINEGSSFSNTIRVRLNLSGIGGATQMRFTGDLSQAIGWRAFANQMDVELNSGAGYKTVRGFFRDAAGNELETTATIRLNRFDISFTHSESQGALGRSVDISRDGTLIVAGVPQRTWLKMMPGGYFSTMTEAGAFIGFYRVGVGSWTATSLQTKDDGEPFQFFGTSVSITPDRSSVLVGCQHFSANIKRYTLGSSGIWSLANTISVSGDGAGRSVLNFSPLYFFYRNISSVRRIGTSGGLAANPSAIPHGDLAGTRTPGGNYRIVFGDTISNDSRGRVTITSEHFGGRVDLVANNAAANNRFGTSVAISADGSTVAAGDDVGQVYLFRYRSNTNSWHLEQRITGAIPGWLNFGTSVAVSGDGSTIIVGSPGESSETGAVYVYATRPGESNWHEVQKIVPSNTGRRFGYSVAISEDGATIAVGSPTHAASGTSYLYVLE